MKIFNPTVKEQTAPKRKSLSQIQEGVETVVLNRGTLRYSEVVREVPQKVG